MAKGKNKKQAVAYHEAGHAYAHLLTRIPFEYVSIKHEEECEGRISGGIKEGFSGAFILISGYVSERLYTGRYNMFTARADFKDLFDIWLSDFPKPAEQEKQLIKYARRVLGARWEQVKAIAEALLERETLTFEQVDTISREASLKH